ncbi:unnamed protein product [Calypogeia fissa]
MISCFRPGPENRKQCVRTSFLASLLNRSAEYFAVSLCIGKRPKAVLSCLPQAASACRVGKIRGKKTHYRRVSEVDFSKTYKIGKTLGVGGFSVVKTGTNILTGEPVAIKIIDRSKYGPKDESLEREIQVLEKVQHPNCICFKECFFTSNSVYLITELVTGGELLDRVLAKGKYTENEAARTIHQVLMGVAYLHSVGIVHRDLKLENILLKTPDNDSVVKIADFGLSKVFAGAAILSTICGSPQYVAPEVLEIGQKRSSYSPAADLWSVGVILYILLSGFSPFDDVSESALFQKIKKGQYSFNAPVWESVSEGGKDLVCRLLCVSPDKRVTAASALGHPWIQEHVLANGTNPKIDETQPLPDIATSALQTVTSTSDIAPSALSTPATLALNQPYREETSESSDDESEHQVSTRSSLTSNAYSLRTESFSPSESASDLKHGDFAQSGHRSKTPERLVHRPKTSHARRNPWQKVAAFKQRIEFEGRNRGKSRNTRFTDMNF